MTNKLRINMVGGGFQHDVSSVAGATPKHVEWNKTDHSEDTSIYIDFALQHKFVDENKTNYGWLAESKTIYPHIYNWCTKNIEQLERNFIHVFTHDLSLTQLSPIFKLVLVGYTSWVKDIQIHKKTKLVSMITSKKTMCKEHHYRNFIADKFKNKCDLFGHGNNPIEKKELGLNDYCFSIAMENGTYPYMFTEKLSDCFATGTIPVYYGCDQIGDFFDADGIIMLTDDFDIDNLSFDLYFSKMEAIQKNFNKIQEGMLPEDQIYLQYIKKEYGT